MLRDLFVFGLQTMGLALAVTLGAALFLGVLWTIIDAVIGEVR